jgi:uncharacterized protein
MATSSPPPAAVTPQLVPVAPQERVPLFDVLRGFCLFGVLWSNLNDWYSVRDPATRFDNALAWTQNWLLEERFYSLLGFLFGIGFAIQLTRAAQRGQDVRDLFLRRMAALLGFGLIHAMLIWHGDILASYALAGFALVLFRNWSPRKLLVGATALWLLYPYVVVHLAAVLNIPLPKYGPAWRQANQQALQAYMHGTWTDATVHGAAQFFGWLYRSLLLGGTASFLALFILGLCAVRVDLIVRLTRRRSTILWALLGGAVCWAGFQYLATNMSHWWPRPTSPANWHDLRFWWPPMGIVFSSFGHATTWASSAVYALIFAFAMTYQAAAKRLQPLAALGRMTLTTYLTQSLVCTVFFYNWGFGLINRVNLTGIFIFTLALFSLQVAFSVWWLRHYQFGPAEWLWRSLTYGKRLPLGIAAARPTAKAIAASDA